MRNRTFGLPLILMLLWCTLPFLAMAQNPAPSALPNLDLRIDGEVAAIARQPDGGVIVGGQFSLYNGLPRSNVLRLQADGSLDPNWHPSVEGRVNALAVDAAGVVYVGGEFGRVDSVVRPFLARIGTDGVLDPSWNPQPDSPVFTLAVNASALFAGGRFSRIGSKTRQNLAKIALTGTGAADASWDPSPSSTVHALALDGEMLYVGGEFVVIGPTNRRLLARVSTLGAGAVDTSFTLFPDGLGVYALSVVGDDLFFGGSFFSAGFPTAFQRQNLAKASKITGEIDSLWNPGANREVRCLLWDGSSQLYVGGLFSIAGGAFIKGVARVAVTGAGAVDTNWTPSPNRVPVNALSFDAAGQILVGGAFSTVGSAARIGLARLNNTGSALAATDTELRGAVLTMAVESNGSSIIGGDFLRANGLPRGNLLRLHANGAMDPSWNPDANLTVRSIAIDAGGAIYATGDFLQVAGSAHDQLVKLAPTGVGLPDASWNPPSPNNVVNTIAVADNALFIGGRFTALGSSQRHRIAKLSLDSGALDPNWGPGADGNVTQIIAGADATIYLAGSFSTVAASFPRAGLARLSTAGHGEMDAWDPNANAGASISVIGLRGNDLYVAGNFSQIGGQNRMRLAKLTTTGIAEADPNWDPGTSDLVSTLLATEEALYVSGPFDAVGGLDRTRIARLSLHSGAADPAWDPGIDDVAQSMVAIGSDIQIGGAFTTVGNTTRVAVARLPKDFLFVDSFESGP